MKQDVVKPLFFAVLLGLFLNACDYDSPASTIQAGQTACSPGQAEIQISDGYFENLCGCTEASGTIVRSPGTFTCTVKAGTVVFFLYLNTRLEHQIISTGGVPFASGAPNPAGTSNKNNLVAQFNRAGTADFEDAFDQGIQGEIIIQ